MLETSAPAATATPRPAVLVIDDDAWVRAVVVELLTDEGYAVEQAVDGLQGLAAVESGHPDVVLLDLALPACSGLDVLHTLKANERTRHIPVLIVSAYGLLLSGDDVDLVAGVVQKPFDVTALLRRIQDAIQAPAPRRV
jgi:CheY-like chemotaxis protein